MREPLGFVQLHHRRNPFQRMEAAKQIFERRRRQCRTERALECQQASPHPYHVLIGFGEVIVDEAVGERSVLAGSGHAPAYRLRETRASSSSRTDDRSTLGAKGLVRYCDAPASIAACRLLSSPRVVSTTTGRSR